MGKRSKNKTPQEPKLGEEIESLEDVELVKEEVLPVEEVKTFSLKAVLDILADDVELSCAVPQLVVVGESGCPVGYATVYLDNKKLMADLVLYYSIPERLSIETGEKLWAGYGFFKYQNTDQAPTLVVTDVRIKSTPPSNPDIPELGKPII